MNRDRLFTWDERGMSVVAEKSMRVEKGNLKGNKSCI